MPTAIYLGKKPYQEGVLELFKMHADLTRTQEIGRLVFMEHEPVITVGKNACRANILAGEEQLIAIGAKLVQSDRGGDVTAHMPGQLMFYPLLHLRAFKLGVRAFVSVIENTIIEMLQSYGIEANSDAKNPGVFCGTKKIASIGLRIANHYSVHGAAINVNNDTILFDYIVPCGLRDKGVTTMSEMLKKEIDIRDVQNKLEAIFRRRLQEL